MSTPMQYPHGAGTTRATRRSQVPGKARVHELAKELGKDSKSVLAWLKENGEFVKSASSTTEAPVARQLREAFPAPAATAAPAPPPPTPAPAPPPPPPPGAPPRPRPRPPPRPPRPRCRRRPCAARRHRARSPQ